MPDFTNDLETLSPERRKLVELLLKAEAQAAQPQPALNPVTETSPEARPLSFAQQRLWFIDQLQPGSSAYNIRTVVRLTGRLNVAALADSLNEIVRRHEVLRTTFAHTDGQPCQVVAPTLHIPLPVVELESLPVAGRELQIPQLTAEETERPFDLRQGPLLRARLLRLSAEEHLLLLTMHHIISDGWSQGILLHELGILYAAFVNGQPSPLPALPMQYGDYAIWQRHWLQGRVLEEQLAFWKGQLGNSLHALELPTDHPRPPVPTSHGARCYFVIPSALTERLKDLGRREGATLFMTLLAAFKVLLYRYTGQSDIVVGSPIAGRNRSELESLMGLFLNVLALRSNLAHNPTFMELLHQVREVALAAYAYQDLPFEKLVEELHLERDLTRNPVYQVMFVLQNAPLPPLRGSGLTLTPMEVTTTTSILDLSLYLRELGPELHGRFEYKTDLFDGATIQRMVGHFQTLLAGIVAHPEQRLSELSVLSDVERQQVLAQWNATQVGPPATQTLHQLFEAQVERTPEAVAAIFEDQQITYNELNRRANQVARHLRRLGVAPEVLVGLCLERSLDMLIGLLGVLKAGGAYVPLDPAYPIERLTFMLEDSQAQVLLTQQPLIARLSTSALQIICLDTDWPVIASESGDNLRPTATVDQLAYVIYTSGSTGRPKGVLGTQRATLNRMAWMWQEYPWSADEVGSQKTTLSFVDSIGEIFGSLLQGIRLVIIPDQTVKDVAALVQSLARQRVTRLVMVPSLLHVVLEIYPQLASQLPNLRMLLASGEALPLDLARRYLDAMPQSLLVNIYGSSEVAADVASYACRELDPILSAFPIGRPVHNTQAYILDAHLTPLPVGLVGELYIGGTALGRGYLHRPDLTAEKFVPDPFATEPGSRLYRMGDLARYRPDGNIEYLGRLDHQVKVRGIRIELGEIEAVLLQHPAIQQAVVVAREDQPGDKQLVAYCASKQDSPPGSHELRRFLQDKLPDYMVPSLFTTLEQLPLTPNGKVDRRALPSPERARSNLEEAFVAPRTPIETALAGIWAHVLRLDRVGVHDNFFELGGHSLLAMQIISRVQNTFQLELPLYTLFKTPTIAGAAEYIETARIAQSLQTPLELAGDESEEGAI